jgi:lysylphosphatidylglycerol synthetase-like protein (DUF2156 family)
MKNLAVIVLLYYTAVWVIVSTLVVYVTRHLQFSPVTLGWLLSGYGLATMVIVQLFSPTNAIYHNSLLWLDCGSCNSENISSLPR